MRQRPIAMGLLLCEQVIVDEETKNITPVNCFSKRTATVFPWDSTPFAVMTWLTDGFGEIAFRVIVERANTLEPIFEKQVVGWLTSPLQQFRLLVRVPTLRFPVAGAYRAALFADGELIAQRRFWISSKEQKHE